MLIANVDCQVCSNGLMLYTMGEISGLFLECAECLTGYRDPADLAHGRFRVEDLREPTRPATVEEARRYLHRPSGSGR
ncbi:hypothetical protein [Asanoa sp. NPDC050611]|uniref:hypothetical protein n=1 Tax=Asanoa sp. NPDC050611 TaxID=3157098 RepID=UPI0033F3D0A1